MFSFSPNFIADIAPAAKKKSLKEPGNVAEAQSMEKTNKGGKETYWLNLIPNKHHFPLTCLILCISNISVQLARSLINQLYLPSCVFKCKIYFILFFIQRQLILIISVKLQKETRSPYTLPFKSLGLVKSFIVYCYNIKWIFEYILKCNLFLNFLWCKVFSVTWSFRNHSNMVICCSRNISYYYQLLKTVVLLHIFWKPWYIFSRLFDE